MSIVTLSIFIESADSSPVITFSRLANVPVRLVTSKSPVTVEAKVAKEPVSLSTARFWIFALVTARSDISVVPMVAVLATTPLSS